MPKSFFIQVESCIIIRIALFIMKLIVTPFYIADDLQQI